MKIPEKIYINDFGSELSYDWHTGHCCENDIEYIRTDAFIDKAAVWFNNNFIVHDKYGVISDSFDTKEEMFEDYPKPYLRPMSSMTEKEKEEMHNVLSPNGTAIYTNEGISMPMNHFGEFVPYTFMGQIIKWFNKHNLDYNGLIEKGLALEAPEGMYE